MGESLNAYKISEKTKGLIGIRARNKRILTEGKNIFITDLLLVVELFFDGIPFGLLGILCWPLNIWGAKLTCEVVFIEPPVSDKMLIKETMGNSMENNTSARQTA